MKMITKEVLTISKTNDLRKLVQDKLLVFTPFVYYKKADDDALYPHIVHNIDRVNHIAMHRDDVSVEINIWTKSVHDANELADSVEAALNNQNLPQAAILPTFYLENRLDVEDEDKTISHIQMTFSVQNYER